MAEQVTKERILREIRRLADENGGSPVGIERFEAATGIRNWHWTGKYWARWSDAVREAGYEPNAWNAQALSDDELLRMLALATRDLGKFPSRGDLGMRRQSHPELPVFNVFSTRFGTRANQINRLVDFADANPEFADVASICAAAGAKRSKAVQPDPSAVVTGVVYLIRMGEFHKIGKSNDPGRRMYELGLRLPEKHDVVHVIETDDPAGIEAYWHRRFAAQRSNGEWFRLSPGDVEAFTRRSYQ